MDYCKICGDDHSPRHKKHRSLCQGCGDAIKPHDFCQICSCLVSENGDGWQAGKFNTDAEAKIFAEQLRRDHRIESSVSTAWTDRYGEEHEATVFITLCNFCSGERDHDNLVEYIEKKRGPDAFLPKALSQALLDGVVETLDGERVEPDADSSPLRQLGLI